ncbi:MAG: glycosyltransferase, partial [Lachnospiraceae bacterium]|nr:glycosyltransferase [Lachnospiraceae bacterium]
MTKKNEKEDILFWTDGVDSERSINEVLNGLKDSSKGYIDATIKARRADISSKSIAKSLPQYVLEDLSSILNYSDKSLLTFADYCDRSVLFPIIDKMLAYVYLNMLISNKIIDKLFFSMTRGMPYTNTELVRIDRDEIINNQYEALGNFKIVVYFSRYADDGMVTQELWNILAAGVFVICSANTDLSTFGNEAPETFKNTWELEKKVRYYLNNPDKRIEKAEITARRAREMGGYDNRVKRILDDLKGRIE